MTEELFESVRDFMPCFIRYINPLFHRWEDEGERLSENAVKVLMAVHHRGRFSPSELSALLRIPKTSLTTIVRGLAEAGLLLRRESREDERKIDLETTPAGEELIARKERHDREAFAALFREAPPEELAEMAAGFRRMAAFLAAGEEK